MVMYKEQMAPGHVYQPDLGSGIEWQPGEARLWYGKQVIETATHHTRSAHEFWHNLVFAACFPTITHWWFGSAWTHPVRLTPAEGNLDEISVWGHMQFKDDSTLAQMWTMMASDPPVVAVPYPPNEVYPVNLPLRLALARLVVGVVTEQISPDEWIRVTSVVPRDQLVSTFPMTLPALPWRLEGIEIPIRDAFCQLQNLEMEGG